MASIQSPRVSSNGSELNSARLISTTIFGGADRPLSTTTLALMQFGQFINHDFESTTQFTFTNGSDISCCSSTGGTLNASQLHPACLPVSVPTNDRFWNVNSTFITTCMNFVRSISGPRLDCSIGYADQLNQNTHWMDASTVYGSTPATAASLRSFTGGLLLTTKDAISATTSRDLLPLTSPCTTGACFLAGDSRATEQPQLTVMHTIWLREHNRIAKALAAVNPTWNDTILFQEARRIVIAEMQHITYNEFITALLSPATITKYSLAPLASGFLTNANTSRVSTGPISNEFATAAFRMGHSLVQGSVQLFAEDGTLLTSSYTMSDTFNNAAMLVNDKTYLDAVIRGLLTEPSQSVDQNVDDSLWNRLFRARNIRFDIVALNIQRGRDHGISSYNTYRQFCGFTKATSFADLSVPSTTNPVIKPDLVPLLQQVYNSVDDIDVYVAGLLEAPLGGSIAGPTLNCLLGEQFNQIKYADRYFYELGGQAHSFSSAQLSEIRKASLARIFCDNSDGTVLSVQPKAFIPVSATNAKVLCTGTTIPSLNLTMWKNEVLF
ncbi:hypothetical protein DAPPUDRAFT_221219 [Daphnia pulex]|uniref:Peroxidase n=1 Tax=Daphnia pulex TaxID=6669 RepID=E9FX28_DAPPU|nr:hypothetical protein DAPPUDRAFT_221219 [Daphnia pulex]|eukprot:EFX87999.1 hypothetical protein DAPPUDRAFT_221219 [Daphnia pulex]